MASHLKRKHETDLAKLCKIMAKYQGFRPFLEEKTADFLLCKRGMLLLPRRWRARRWRARRQWRARRWGRWWGRGRREWGWAAWHRNLGFTGHRTYWLCMAHGRKVAVKSKWSVSVVFTKMFKIVRYQIQLAF